MNRSVVTGGSVGVGDRVGEGLGGIGVEVAVVVGAGVEVGKSGVMVGEGLANSNTGVELSVFPAEAPD